MRVGEKPTASGYQPTAISFDAGDNDNRDSPEWHEANGLLGLGDSGTNGAV